MKVERKAYLEPKNLTNEEVIEKLKEFTEQATNWNFGKATLKILTMCSNFPSCTIYFEDQNKIERNICIEYNDKNNEYYVGNIFPLDTFTQENSCTKVLEYNHYCQKFVKDFRSFCKKNQIPIVIHFSKEDIGLDKIISGTKVRKCFEAYLRQYPAIKSDHGIERLDKFICAVSRCSKQGINLDLLKRYLIEDLNWNLEDAESCVNRIEIGLEILKVNKSFY